MLADEERVLAQAPLSTVKLMRVCEEAEATARMEAMLAEVAAAAGVSLGAVTPDLLQAGGLATSEAARALGRGG